jgi:hypothetical protein
VHTNWLLSSSSGGACRTKWKTLYISKRSVCLQTFTGSCSVGSDKWVDLTIDDIRRMEEETKRQLDEMRQKDPVKGMTADD